mmetsp:Transcript_16351/g.42148  ORF Transcript_16351/g.42148 Transcript_16351/m.42148 type:complete len:112 (+) Transcript_16351:419-754(+)
MYERALCFKKPQFSKGTSPPISFGTLELHVSHAISKAESSKYDRNASGPKCRASEVNFIEVKVKTSQAGTKKLRSGKGATTIRYQGNVYINYEPLVNASPRKYSTMVQHRN